MTKKLLIEKQQNKIAELINLYQLILMYLSFTPSPKLKLMYHE